MNRDKYPRYDMRNDCCCTEKTELEYLVASAGCSEDFAAVSALPDQWTPKKSGPILANYLKEREQSHRNVIDDMMRDSKIANDEIDDKVRTLAEVLLADVRENQRNIDCTVQKYSPDGNKLTINERKEALTDVNKILSQRLEDLSKFKVESFSLEKERATKLKRALQLYFQKLVAVGHKSPKELLHEFDEHIYDVNQQLMSNSRAYLLLEAKLRGQSEDSLVHARSRLNHMCFAIAPLWTRARSAQAGSRESKPLHSRSSSANDHRKSFSADPSQISHHMDELENCISRLVDAYRSAVLKVFMGFSGHLDKLHKEIGDHTPTTAECSQFTMPEVHKIIDKAVCSLGTSICSGDIPLRDVLEMTRTNVLNLQKSLFILGEYLRDTYSVLHDAGHLWDAHMVRLALAQKLTMAFVEDLVTNHDALEQANEVVFNIALEQLRAAPDADKLQQYYDVILVTLDRGTDLYQNHGEVEIGKLEEFHNLGTLLADILIAEYNCFLDKYPKSPIPVVKGALNTPKISSPRNSLFSARTPIPRAILQTELQNVALCNWKNGFLESFVTNMPLVSEQLNIQIQLWIDEKCDILRMRHSMKLMSHSIRKERVKAARDIRAAELRFHEARLNSHLDAIYDLVDDLPTEASEFADLDTPTLYPLGKWLNNIQSNINELFARDPLDPEVKRLKMCSYASRLVKHRQLFVESLNAAAERFKGCIEYRVQVARVSNVRFMSQLTLLGEGGKYAASEALKTCTALVRGADALEACVNRAFDCLNHRRSQLLSLADQHIGHIQKIVDEVLKSSYKGGQEKKKPITGKK